MTKDQNTGFLLVGHGTRDALGQNEFRQVAEMLRTQLPDTPVADCFLELASPDIGAGVDTLVQAGVRRIVALPLLLFTAGHAKRDIPEAIDAAVANHAGLSWTMAAPLGEHPAVLKLAKQRFDEALKQSLQPEAGATLFFISRGSSDPEAIDSVQQFFQRHRANLQHVTAERVCFLAAAEPTFADTLHWAARQTPRQVVVQPHLLFHGQLMQEVRRRIAELAEDPGQPAYHIADYLGPSSEIVTALLDRLREVGD